MKATIRLFRALPIKIKRKKNSSKELLEKTIKRGFIFSPEVVANYSDFDKLINLIEKEVGLTPEQLNASFHKSWQKIKEADIEQLVVEQIAHYLTTYGKEHPKEYLIEKEEQWGVDNLAEKVIELGDFESDKIQDENYVYIPKEKLEIPKLDIKGIKLIVIKGYTKKELKEKLLQLLQSGIALAEDTIIDIIEVCDFVKLSEKDIESIRNREVKVRLYEELNLIPEDPTEFMRYLLYKATGSSLLIKNQGTIEQIKENTSGITSLFVKYKKQVGLNRLAEIFYRFKPLFLAFRETERLRPVINRIRKLARKYHKPMPEDYLNLITSKIKNGVKINKTNLQFALQEVNIFRKIRLAYALRYRTKDNDSILYKIRNGKGYATDFHFTQKLMAKKILDIVLDSITKDISKNVKGKKIYIPEYINYTLPATEKQFTGNFPSGTYVTIPKDMIFGVHWDNVGSHRIDLDLSLIGSDAKYGWDANYRDEARSILFSGDMTDAQRGATELFYVKRQAKNSCILFVNYYNYDENVEVPFKILVAKELATNFRKNYMVNPNNVISIAKSKINQKQKMLGLLTTTANECRFYFTESYIGSSITSGNSEFAENSRKYLFNFYEKAITLNDVLEKAGAKIVKDKKKCDIDLSPEELEKDTILNLINLKGGGK